MKAEELEWMEGVRPLSKRYSDIYFAEEDGLEESRYVFLKQNRLPDAWATPSRSPFVIGELGFGTGLNFLATWELWNRTKPSSRWLHYISCEKFPLDAEQIRKTISRWPELHELQEQLLERYEILYAGPHLFRFEKSRVVLHLLVGDVMEVFSDLRAQVDAWFFDGFSPSKNQEMWSENLFQLIANHSRLGTTFSTYAAAGFVRRNIQAAGFEVVKFPGYGRKREMLRGELKTSSLSPWLSPAPLKIAVIGGGLAGTSVAWSLSKRGHQVTLFERQAALAQEASGNRTAVFFPALSKEETTIRDFSISGLQQLRDHRFNLQTENSLWNFCGVLKLAYNEIEKQRLQSCLLLQNEYPALARWVTAEEASALAGTRVNFEAVYFPSSGSVKPQSWCDSFAKQNLFPFETKALTSILELQETGHGIIGLDLQNNICFEADRVILANAHEATQFQQTKWLPLMPVRGQLLGVPSYENNPGLKTIICYDGYLTPKVNGFHTVGSSYDREDLSLDIRTQETNDLLKRATEIVPEFPLNISGPLEARVSLRASAPGQLPLVGDLSCSGSKHLYINTAYASRGSLYAIPCAEIIAAKISQEPLPASGKVAETLSPLRHYKRLNIESLLRVKSLE